MKLYSVNRFNTLSTIGTIKPPAPYRNVIGYKHENYNSFNPSHLKNTIFLTLLLSASTCFAHSWMAPENEAKRENPIKVSPESIAIGKELFIDLCSSCHGLNGTGLKKQETGLSKDTPHLPTHLSTHSDGDFHWKIKNGKGEMPSFSDELTDTEVWKIINFLKAK